MTDSFSEKLKKRRIWKTVVGYPAASFVILQAVDFFISRYGLNPKALTFSLVLLSGGFIIALLWNWFHGEIGHQNYSKKEVLVYSVLLITTFTVAFYSANNYTVNSDIATGAIEQEKDYRLAVLPFTGNPGDATLDYLSEGIPENLINRLAQNTKLELVSRASSFILESDLQNADGVLNHLKANLMLTGQIDRLNNTLVVNCQLTDTERNRQIWGNKVIMANDDILRVEENMVSSLMTALPEKFKKNQIVSKSWSDNAEAQSHYMKGRALSYGSTSAEEERALDHFREAIRLDSKFVAAYVAIANEQVVQAMFATDTRAEIFNEARIAVQTALALNPNYAEAYTVDAAIKFYMDRDWTAAETAYKKAITLDPNNANAHIRYTFFLTTLKRYDEALKYANKAIELDPISRSSLHNLGWANLVAGNYATSEKAFSDALEIHPNWIWGYVKRSYTRIFQDKCDMALSDRAQARRLIGDWGTELLEACLIFIADKCNDEQLKSQSINQYLSKVTIDNYMDPMAMAVVYACKGDYEKSLEWNQIAIDEETTGFYQFTLDYAYPKEILDAPRFIQMKKDLNLPL